MENNDTSVASKGKYDADAAAETRKKLREALLNGNTVEITQSGDVKVEITQSGDVNQESEVKLEEDNDDLGHKYQLYADSAAEIKRKLREELLKGDNNTEQCSKEALEYQEEIRKRFFTSNMDCNDVSSKQKLCEEIKCHFERYTDLTGNKILVRRAYLDGYVPRWYEANPKLLKDEIELINMHYPGFTLKKDVYGTLCWIGVVNPIIVRSEAEYTLRLLYGNGESQIDIERAEIITTNNNESNMNYKLFEIIPHLKHHLERLPVLCSTCAADCLTRTIKWLNVYELFLAGYISESEFEFIAYSKR